MVKINQELACQQLGQWNNLFPLNKLYIILDKFKETTNLLLQEKLGFFLDECLLNEQLDPFFIGQTLFIRACMTGFSETDLLNICTLVRVELIKRTPPNI